MFIPCRAALMAVALCSCALAQEEALHPQTALWLGIKRQLMAPDGEQYFESNLKGTALPSLRGTVVQVSPPNLVQLNLSGGTTPEVLLRLSTGQKLPEKAEEISFGQAEPVAFTREPFLLTMEVDAGKAPGPQSSCPFKFDIEKNYGPALGTVLNGRYYHVTTGIEFDIPPGWCVLGTVPSSGTGDHAALYNTDFPNAEATVWMVRQNTPPAMIPARLQAAIPENVKQRSNLAKYTIRPESIDSTWIGGNQALRAIADYEDKGKQMSETLTWIYTERTHALFFARAEANVLPALQTHFDQIIYSAKIP